MLFLMLSIRIDISRFVLNALCFLFRESSTGVLLYKAFWLHLIIISMQSYKFLSNHMKNIFILFMGQTIVLLQRPLIYNQI